MKTSYSYSSRDDERHDWQKSWPCIEKVDVLDCGQAIGILLREFDGTISAIRIGIEQLAD